MSPQIERFICYVTTALIVFAAGCGSKEKSKDANEKPGDKNSASAREAKAPTYSEVIERYSLLELNDAATAMRVIFDESLSQNPRESVLECEISGERAQSYMMPLKALIDAQIEKERDDYLLDPAQYAKSRGFEVCESRCACGVLAAVLERISREELKTQMARERHSNSLQRLNTKAKVQSPRESLMCARKQDWFCKSPLKSYLDQQSAGY